MLRFHVQGAGATAHQKFVPHAHDVVGGRHGDATVFAQGAFNGQSAKLQAAAPSLDNPQDSDFIDIDDLEFTEGGAVNVALSPCWLRGYGSGSGLDVTIVIGD